MHFCALLTALIHCQWAWLMNSPLKDSSFFLILSFTFSASYPSLYLGSVSPKKQNQKANFLPFQKITCPVHLKFGLKVFIQMSLTCQRRITLFFLGYTEFKINLCQILHGYSSLLYDYIILFGRALLKVILKVP